MPEFLTRKFFGIPAWGIALGVGSVGYFVMKRRRAKGASQTNPAASANEDGSQPMPFSSPDMFPMQSMKGTVGPAGPPGPPGPRGARGINATPARRTSVQRTAHQQHVAHQGHVRHVQHQTVGNRPAYNARIGASRPAVTAPARKAPSVIKRA